MKKHLPLNNYYVDEMKKRVIKIDDGIIVSDKKGGYDSGLQYVKLFNQ